MNLSYNSNNTEYNINHSLLFAFTKAVSITMKLNGTATKVIC